MSGDPPFELATFAAGCFWDIEAVFRRHEGVLATVTGYMGGFVPDPTYDQVSSGTTGHAEAVQVAFDPLIITYEDLLDIFWSCHDPAKPPEGSERSALFTHTPRQQAAALASRDRMQETLGDRKITTIILPAETFWKAEECHQQYYEKCGRSYATIPQYRE